MIRTLQLVSIYSWRAILQWFAWRSFIMTLALNQMVAPLLGLAVWLAALPGNSTISIYYISLLAVQLLTVSYEHHTFSNGIYSGEVSNDLLRPHAVVIAPLGENIAIRFWHFLFGLPVMLIVTIATQTAFDLRLLFMSIPALILAAILRFLFTYLLALSAFWTQQAHGVVGFGETLIFLLGGAAAPLTLFPAGLREIGMLLPFWALLGFPADIVAGNLNEAQIMQGYLVQLIWMGIIGILTSWVWRLGVQRFTAVGG
jgi:ABC-2 type transport system permease protein